MYILLVSEAGMLESVSFLEVFIFGAMIKKEEPALLLLECTENNVIFKNMELVRKRINLLT